MKKYLVETFIATTLLISLFFNCFEFVTIIKQDKEIYKLQMAAKADSIIIDNYYKMLIDDAADKK